MAAKYPEADLGGSVSEVYVRNGDSVSAGTEILKIVGDNTLYIDFLFAYADSSDFYEGQTATIFIDGLAGPLTGTVTAVSQGEMVSDNGMMLTTVRVKAVNPGLVTSNYTASASIGSYVSYGESPIQISESSVITAQASGKISGLNFLAGDSIFAGDRICTITGDSVDNAIESARISVSNAATSLESAQENLEDYSITAPISGTVVTKNVKVGDNVQNGSSASTLAVIYDLSSLTFQMNIDELDISQVSAGQEVQVTADAFENEVFSGTVTNVSMEGTSSNGVTYYPVTVTLNELGNLLPGMNVDGVIVVDSAEQALAVPADALQRGNVVYVKDDSVTEAQGRVPAGFREVQVETGVINSDYVEIVSGDLQEGDQVYVSESSVSSTNSMMPMGGGNMGGMGGAMGGGNRPGGSSGGGPGGGGPGGSGRR